MQGVDLVMRGGAHNVFCAVRPPGHHAEPDKAMGFWCVEMFILLTKDGVDYIYLYI
jgi:hypothetical protein